MLDLLKKYNYIPPKLEVYNKNNLYVKKVDHIYELYVNDDPWMIYDTRTHGTTFEVFSHYYLAKGHCICTGMGFGSRENWLLNKKEVSKVTIIENNEELIEYHKYINSPFLEHCEIIIGDASNIKNKKCDTLLLDHYEFNNRLDILKDVQHIIKNIECNTLWFWPLEHIINTIVPKSNIQNNGMNYYLAYNWIKEKYNLNCLPNLNIKEINTFCTLNAMFSNIWELHE